MRQQDAILNAAVLVTTLIATPAIGDLMFSGFGFLEQPLGTSVQVISADGSVVVGKDSTTNGQFAILWTAATGITHLTTASGENLRENANAASADGSIIVGDSGPFRLRRIIDS